MRGDGLAWPCLDDDWKRHPDVSERSCLAALVTGQGTPLLWHSSQRHKVWDDVVCPFTNRQESSVRWAFRKQEAD